MVCISCWHFSALHCHCHAASRLYIIFTRSRITSRSPLSLCTAYRSSVVCGVVFSHASRRQHTKHTKDERNRASACVFFWPGKKMDVGIVAGIVVVVVVVVSSLFRVFGVRRFIDLHMNVVKRYLAKLLAGRQLLERMPREAARACEQNHRRRRRRRCRSAHDAMIGVVLFRTAGGGGRRACCFACEGTTSCRGWGWLEEGG